MLCFTSCTQKQRVHVYGEPQHELVKLLKQQNSLQVILHADLTSLLSDVKENEAVMLLSKSYPEKTLELPSSIYSTLAAKNIRAYIEYPSVLPTEEVAPIKKVKLERMVVSSHFFEEKLDSLNILSVSGLHFLEMKRKPAKTHLVAAKVGGFDEAIYGLPDEVYPLLFQENNQLIATTNLSKFISGRYLPQEEWGVLWEGIVSFLAPNSTIKSFTWEPVVRPTYTKTEQLPNDAVEKAIQRGMDWYTNARMLVPASYEDTIKRLAEEDVMTFKWSEDIPIGDGSNGLFECIFSEIDENGSQPICAIRRGDCISETSMAYATAGTLFNNEEYKQIAINLLDYYLYSSPAMKGEYGDPKHPAYGLIPWGLNNYAWYRASYGDDNARFLLAAWVSSALLKTEQWDEPLMRSLLGLLRTTGVNGFRTGRLLLENLEKLGWEHYEQADVNFYSPHFECYLMACYLWTYDKCGDKRFLDKAKLGIKNLMAHYTDGWTWTNGLSQERARIILPLAWLVRVEDTPENREQLMMAVNDLLALQDDCGAIQEEIGEVAKGCYPPPQSNEDYGKTEASLIAKNGDQVTDLLYTTNFAFLGLNEAYHTTGDQKIKESLEKMKDFLCRVQVTAPTHPELDGGWMRAFDFNRFEYWGSNADSGWGAWVIETGWTQGWIVTLLSFMEMDQSIWDLTEDSKIASNYEELKNAIYPER